MSQLDPIVNRIVSFVFPRCQVRLDGEDLLVTVPVPATLRGVLATHDSAGIRWDGPYPATGELVLTCDGEGNQRLDASEYQPTHAYEQAATFRFQGGVLYGRTLSQGGWALEVAACVRSSAGLPAGWESWDGVLVESNSPTKERAVRPGDQPGPVMAAASMNGGSINGPHTPFP